VGKRLFRLVHEHHFFRVSGHPGLDEVSAELVELRGIFMNVDRGEAMPEGIHAAGGFPFSGARTCGSLGVAAVGLDLTCGCHSSVLSAELAALRIQI
jgi:hypothetical protein